MVQITIEKLQNFYKSIYKSIEDNLRPNPKYMKTLLQQEIAHKRNKAVFAICFFYQFIFLYDLLINNGPILANITSLFSVYFAWLILFLSCQYQPQIFKFYYSILCLSYGPTVMNGGPENLIYACVNTGILSLLVQAVTGSYNHYIFQTICQAILMNTIYQKPLGELLASNSPERILKSMTFSVNFMLLIQALIVVLIHRFLAQAQEQAYNLEQKKTEAENQKTFLLSFSHELRNLINSLTGNVKLATLENIGGRAKEFLLNAEVCGELLLHMINNILDSGKAAIGELEINPASTKTYDTFERIWGICSELIRRKDLKGSMKIPRNLPCTLMIDQHRLTQIFLNLVGNAIKFTEKGSIDISIEWLPNKQAVNEECFQPYPFNTSDDQDEGLFEKWKSFTYLNQEYIILNQGSKGIDHNELKPAYAVSKGVIKMTVTDEGCGMSKEQTSKLFQKFMQVTEDSSKKKLGTGLGLFITKQLCQRMNGEIRVFSQIGRGSSFMICIPVDVVFENNQHLNSLESIRTYAANRNLKAMVIDEARYSHNILEYFFNSIGIAVTDFFSNGREAINKYSEYANERKCPDIIAMDLDMPIMDGKQASQKIRQLEREKGLRPSLLIIISSNCMESEIAGCLNQEGRIRANAFLRKPVSILDLTRAVASFYLNR